MRSFVLNLFTFCLVFVGAVNAPAKAEEPVVDGAITDAMHIEHYVLEKPHTQILFSANHLGFSQSFGRFKVFDGSFVLNHDDLSRSSVQVVIDAASIEMGHEKWNAHLKNEDFLDVEKFPEIRFESDSVEVVDEKTAKVSGILSMHGVDKAVTLDVVHNKSAVHPFSGKYITGFSAETEIKRSDFGMTFGLPLLSDTVKITISVEGIRQVTTNGEGQNDKAEE